MGSITFSLDPNRSLDENAGIYFTNAKKAKKKLEGTYAALEQQKKRYEAIQRKVEKNMLAAKNPSFVSSRKKEWYEKFRWFWSSEGFLCLGGRDATTNEILIKKHLEPQDYVFHTEMSGSPFFVVKSSIMRATKNPLNPVSNKAIANPQLFPQHSNASIPGSQTFEEIAQATASFSRAWKAGIVSLDVFCVKPEQVSKTPKAGEYLSKGSFMVYGQKTTYKKALSLAVGMIPLKPMDDAFDQGDNENTLSLNPESNANLMLIPMCAPLSAIRAHAKPPYYLILQGKKKPSDVAKLLAQAYSYSDLDEWIRILPPGTMEVRQQ
ncbi:MAG: NFACT RNA binding domain-containing protein [Candidatus Woesearchaeota archaeon]